MSKSEASRRWWANHPEMRAHRAEQTRAAMADPSVNPLAGLSEAERTDYDRLTHRYGCTRDDALRAVKSRPIGVKP